jgi:hypothetical protein
MAEQVSPSHLKALAGAAGGDIDGILSTPGMGAVCYGDGNTRTVLSYGVPRAQLPSTYPPANYGTMGLIAYCPARPVEATMLSPLMNREEIPQIRMPPRGPSRTVHPGEPFTLGRPEEPNGQEPPNPLAHLAPSQQEAPPPPSESPGLSGAAWWARAIR